MIKKTLSLLLLICVLFSFSACALFPNGTEEITWRMDENTIIVQNTNTKTDKEPDNKKTDTSVEEKTVTDKRMTITLVGEDGPYKAQGLYTGDVRQGKPHGHGKWVFRDGDSFYHEYDGNFSNGMFDGKGVEITKSTSANRIWKYEGEFSDGQYNGYGIETQSLLEDGTIISQKKGAFTNGEFTPTLSEAYNYFGSFKTFGGFSLSDAQCQYIDSHTELFFTCEKATAEATELKNFSYKQFTKTRKQEDIGLVKLKLTAQQVFEDDIMDGKLTSLLAYDSEYNLYSVFYYNSVEVYDGDSFVTYAIPCGTSSFDNIGGGVTSTVVLLACYMK